MPTTAELALQITARDSASKVLDGVGKSAGGLGKVLGDVGKIASGFLAANVVAGGVQKLTGFMGDSVAAIKESIAVGAQLDAVLKSTGGAAGVTAQQVKDMAAGMEKLSLFEDEAIISSSNLLLTFTNIGSNVFPQAQQAVIDMSQALGQDLKSSSIQLGKALNDPINGITALSRVGVSFTEEQKALIETMVQSGDVAGAQAVILAELNKEFGGSAQAASDAAGASERYKDRMNDLKEEIGTKMLPVQEAITEAKLKMVELLTSKVIPVLESLYAQHWPAISKAISDVVAFIQTTWPQIQPIFQFAAEYVIARVEGMIQVVQSVIEIVTSVINLVSALFHGEWATAWNEMKDIASGVIDLFVGTVKALFGNLPGEMVQIGKEIMGGLIKGIKDSIPSLNDVLSYVTDLMPKRKGPLDKDRSLLYPAGQAVMQGLVRGIESESPILERTLASVTDKIRSAADAMRARNAGPGGMANKGTSAWQDDDPSAPNYWPTNPSQPNPPGRTINWGDWRPSSSNSSSGNSVAVPSSSSSSSELRGTARLPSGLSVNVNVYGSIHSDKDITRVVRDAILGGGFRGVIASPEAT